MKKLYTILNAAFWCFIGVFLGVSLYTCWDYRAHPGLYALQSAPWYLSIQIHAVFTVVVCGMLALGIWILRKKMQSCRAACTQAAAEGAKFFPTNLRIRRHLP